MTRTISLAWPKRISYASCFRRTDSSITVITCGTAVDEPGKRAADTFLINEKPATDCEIISKQRPSAVVRGNLKQTETGQFRQDRSRERFLNLLKSVRVIEFRKYYARSVPKFHDYGWPLIARYTADVLKFRTKCYGQPIRLLDRIAKSIFI